MGLRGVSQRRLYDCVSWQEVELPLVKRSWLTSRFLPKSVAGRQAAAVMGQHCTITRPPLKNLNLVLFAPFSLRLIRSAPARMTHVFRPDSHHIPLPESVSDDLC